MLKHHFESRAEIAAGPADVFAFLDDHRRLSSHMTQSSWMMAGSRMAVELDEHEGRALGSKITLKGTFLGIRLEVEEVVTEYHPPFTKTWQTVGTPKLLVVGPYMMGFALHPQHRSVSLRVFIDYCAPERGLPHLLGRLLGRTYAAWCTTGMTDDAAAHFRRLSTKAT